MSEEDQKELYSEIASLLSTCTCDNLVGEVLEDLEHIKKYCDNVSSAFLKGMIKRLQQKQKQ